MPITLEAFKSGYLQKDLTGYHYFVPTKINSQWIWNTPEINALLEKAAVKLGELNSFAKLVPNVDLFIQLHVTKEAVISSRIEGTQTNIGEAFLPEDDVSPNRKGDWDEVNNYIQAMHTAILELERLPISSRLICQTHAVLLRGVRGEHKQPGQIRTSQNWIGGSGPGDAVFVPPHPQYLNELMSDLENFIHNQDISVPELIRIAIAHYQFETIHPFLDGNGRIGRLLITLFLISQKILDQPLLYLSYYFEKNKGLYYDNLTFVRTKNDMTQWLKYFIVGIEETATLAVKTLSEVIKLRTEIDERIKENLGRRATPAYKLLQALFKKPVISISEVSASCGLSKKAANDLVSEFVSEGILVEITGQRRNRLFSFDRYLDLFIK